MGCAAVKKKGQMLTLGVDSLPNTLTKTGEGTSAGKIGRHLPPPDYSTDAGELRV